MKIKEFTLENFKSFKDSNNSVKTASDINFIYGENNSGKSNILKFLKLIFNSKKNYNKIVVDGEELSQHSSSYFFDGLLEFEPYIYHKNLRKTSIAFSCSLELSYNEITMAEFDIYESLKVEYLEDESKSNILTMIGEIKSLDFQSLSEINLKLVQLNGKEVYQKEDDVEYFFRSGEKTQNLLNDKLGFQKFMAYLNNITLFIDNDRFFRKEKVDHNIKILTPHNFKNWLYNFSIDEFRYNEYLELLAFIKENKFSSLKLLSNLDLSYSIDENSNIEILLNNGSERLPIDSFGTGVSQILFIFCKIYDTNSRIILLEEFDLNLSPKTQNDLFKLLKKMIDDNHIDQIFFTSHSDHFNFRDDFSVYEVKIDAKGVSSVDRMNGKERSSFFD